MNTENFLKSLFIIKEYVKKTDAPVYKLSNIREKDPFKILVSTVLSLRTRDVITKEVTEKLFSIINSPHEVLKIGKSKIEEMIKKVGFYKNKAKTIFELSSFLVENYNGEVPDEFEILLKVKGIGRKTATLVMIEAFDKDYICVDTHVHRISNRLGIVNTKKPYETERLLMQRVPKEYWKMINISLVAFGQTLCNNRPKCYDCPVNTLCEYDGKRLKNLKNKVYNSKVV